MKTACYFYNTSGSKEYMIDGYDGLVCVWNNLKEAKANIERLDIPQCAKDELQFEKVMDESKFLEQFDCNAAFVSRRRA